MLPLYLQTFHPNRKKKRQQKNTLGSQKFIVDRLPQELGLGKILNSGCGHAVKPFVE